MTTTPRAGSAFTADQIASAPTAHARPAAPARPAGATSAPAAPDAAAPAPAVPLEAPSALGPPRLEPTVGVVFVPDAGTCHGCGSMMLASDGKVRCINCGAVEPADAAPEPAAVVAVPEAAAVALHVDPWPAPPPPPTRHRLPDERASYVRKFRVGACKGYYSVGLYPDGRPGELFIFVDGAGSTLRGSLDGAAIDTSMLLQYAVPLEVIAWKHIGRHYEPSGPTGDPVRPFATSVLDLVFHRMMHRHAPSECLCRAHIEERDTAAAVAKAALEAAKGESR